MSVPPLRVRPNPPGPPLLRSLIGAASGNSLGMLVAQAIALGSMIIVARLFSPKDLGLLGTVMALVAVLIPLATLSYPNAIPIAANRGRAITLSWLALRGSLLMLLAVAFIAIGGMAAGGWEGGELLLVALGVPVMAFNTVATQFSLRLGLIGTRAAAVVAGALAVAGLRIGAGLADMDGTALVLAGYAGFVVTGMILVLYGSGLHPSALRRLATVSHSEATAKRFRPFPRYSTPHALLRYGSLALPPLMLAQFIGPAMTGQYTLAATAVAGPVLVIADAVGSAILSPLSAAYRRDPETSLDYARRLSMLLAAIIIPVVVLTWYILPWLFEVIFGEGWEMATDFSLWLLLWAAALLVTRPVVLLLAVQQRLRASLRIEAIVSLLRFAGLVAGLFIFDNVTTAVALFALAGVLGSALNVRIAFLPVRPPND